MNAPNLICSRGTLKNFEQGSAMTEDELQEVGTGQQCVGWIWKGIARDLRAVRTLLKYADENFVKNPVSGKR